MTYLNRKCPVCGSEGTTGEGVQSKIKAEDLSIDELRPSWNGFFKEKIIFTYCRCAKCQLLYSPTYFSEDQLTELYNQMPDNTAGVPLDALKKTQKGYFNILKEHSALDGDYLEMGPDIGLFVDNCFKEANFSKYWLYEPNKAVWEVLENISNDQDVKLSSEMFEFSDVPDHNVNVAVMIHVLDHLEDPSDMLQKLSAKLKKGAVLITVTHDESSWLAKLLGVRWPAYCLQHPQLFNPKTIKALMSSVEFDVVDVRKTVNHFPLTYLIKHLFWSLGFKFKVPQYDNIQLPLRLGNILTVAIKK